MARPERHDADYFPFIVKDGKTLFILESKYGLQGIGFFTQLMRFLTRQPDHHIRVIDEAERLYFFAQLHCPEDIGMDMLSLMGKTGKIDAALWHERGVIVSADLLNSLEGAYKNRHNKIITIEQIRVSYQDNEITYQDNTAHAGLCHEILGHNPQTKLKDRILKESIGDGVSYLPVDNPEQPEEKEPLEENPKPTPLQSKSRHHRREMSEGEAEELRELVQKVIEAYPYDKYRFNLNLWLQNHIQDHPLAILTALKRLLEAQVKGEPIVNVRTYADRVVQEETKTLNAGDVQEEAEQFKKPTTKAGMTAIGKALQMAARAP